MLTAAVLVGAVVIFAAGGVWGMRWHHQHIRTCGECRASTLEQLAELEGAQLTYQGVP